MLQLTMYMNCDWGKLADFFFLIVLKLKLWQLKTVDL